MGFPTAWFIVDAPAALAHLAVPDHDLLRTNLLIRTFAINQIIRNEGFLNTFLIKIGVISEPLNLLYTDLAVFLGMTYVYLPLMVLPLYAAIERFDHRLLEAGYDLYAQAAQVLRRIIFPTVKPGTTAGRSWSSSPRLVFRDAAHPGGGRNMMIGNFIDLQFGQGCNWPRWAHRFR